MKTYTRLYSFVLNFSIKNLACFALGLLFLPSMVSAHETGASLEAVEGNYKLDVGYVGELITTSPVIFDFNLISADTNLEQNFDSVWVRLGNQSGVKLSTRLNGNGSAGDKTILNYQFLEKGDYTLLARFASKDGFLVEHTFSFKVEGESSAGNEPSKSVLLSAVTGFFVGLLITRLFF